MLAFLCSCSCIRYIACDLRHISVLVLQAIHFWLRIQRWQSHDMHNPYVYTDMGCDAVAFLCCIYVYTHPERRLQTFAADAVATLYGGPRCHLLTLSSLCCRGNTCARLVSEVTPTSYLSGLVQLFAYPLTHSDEATFCLAASIYWAQCAP